MLIGTFKEILQEVEEEGEEPQTEVHDQQGEEVYHGKEHVDASNDPTARRQIEAETTS